MIRFRQFRVEDGKGGVEKLYSLSMKCCGVRIHDGSSSCILPEGTT